MCALCVCVCVSPVCVCVTRSIRHSPWRGPFFLVSKSHKAFPPAYIRLCAWQLGWSTFVSQFSLLFTCFNFTVFHFVWHPSFVELGFLRWLMFQTFRLQLAVLSVLSEAFRGIGYTSLSQSTPAGPVVSGTQRGVEVHDSAWISLIKTTPHHVCVCECSHISSFPSGYSLFFSLSCHGSGIELLIRYLRWQNISYFFTLSMPCHSLLCPCIFL